MIWQPMDTAPRSTIKGRIVTEISILALCEDKLEGEAIDPCVIWWEPVYRGGCWVGDGGYEMHPLLWAPIPDMTEAIAYLNRGRAPKTR